MTWIIIYCGVALLGFWAGFVVSTKNYNDRLETIKSGFKTYIKESQERISKEFPKVQKEIEAQEWLSKALKISQEQYDLVQIFDYPSKSASHSKYKNELSKKIKSLEEEKTELLLKVLDSGYNPSITIMVEGKKKQVKLADYLTESGYGAAPQKIEPKLPPARKLTLIKNPKEITDDASPSSPS